MAFARIARTGLRRSGGAKGNYTTEKDAISEGISFSKYQPSLENAMLKHNNPYIFSIGKMDILSFQSRGYQATLSSQLPSTEKIACQQSVSEPESMKYPGLEATRPGEKPRVVVLGTGWAACRFMKGLDTKMYDIVCISPRNHMVFTPLLASTCVGTLEFRSVTEPVGQIQSALATDPNCYFYLASCTGIDTSKHEVYCETVENLGQANERHRFRVAYDKLVIAVGSDPLTFNIKGVQEHAIFLREVNHAQEIRRKLLSNLMLSQSPDSLLNTYKKAALNLLQLGILGATIFHEVDARKMNDHPLLNWRKFDFIIYNFPHAGFYGSEDNPDMIKLHQSLVYDFFSNARWMLKHNGQIHVTHKTKPPYSTWNLRELAHKNSLLLKECVPFDIKDYPLYENKRGHSSAIDEPFDWRDSCTFKFTVAPPSPDIYSYDYSSAHFNLQGCRDALPRVKFVVKAEVRHFPRAAGYAGVLVDEYHSVRAMFWGPLPYMGVNFAELLAVKCALLMYERSHLCYRNVALDVESNSNVAVSWIRSNFGNTLELSTELLEITMALGRIRNPVEFFCSYGEYGGEHYHLVHRLALTALDTTNMCERWYPENTGY